MKVFLAVMRPIEFDTTGVVDEAAMRDIDAVNDEMEAAGVRFFAGGMKPLAHTKSIRRDAGGKLSVTDGPFIETKELLNGFWILEVADMDEAVAWGEKAAAACRSHIEIRPFH